MNIGMRCQRCGFGTSPGVGFTFNIMRYNSCYIACSLCANTLRKELILTDPPHNLCWIVRKDKSVISFYSPYTLQQWIVNNSSDGCIFYYTSMSSFNIPNNVESIIISHNERKLKDLDIIEYISYQDFLDTIYHPLVDGQVWTVTKEFVNAEITRLAEEKVKINLEEEKLRSLLCH